MTLKALFIGGWDGQPFGKTIGYTHYWHFLRSNGVEVINGCIEKSRFSYSAYRHFPLILLETLWRWPRLLAKNLGQEFDFALVSFPCFYDVPLAKLVCLLRGKPLVYHPVDSQYLTLVEDRKLARKGSLKEKIFWLYDKIPFDLADAVCVHGKGHLELFPKKFGVDPKKFLVVPQGCFREPPDPRPKRSKTFVAGLASSFIPHHGMEYVLEAARRVQESEGNGVEFKIIGFGQLEPAMREKARVLGLKNLEFLGGVSAEEAADFTANESDVVLGVFGGGIRADLNVPNKLWAALAYGKPLITAKSRGVKELGIEHGKHAWLVPKADPAALARAIAELKRDPGLRRRLGENALRLFKENYTVNKLGALLLRQLRERGLVG